MLARTAMLAALGAITAGSLTVAGESQHAGEVLILNEEFDGDFNFDLWQHEITMGGGGNWEFQVYGNNRTNSYLQEGKLVLQPTLTEDFLGADAVRGATPTTYDIWGLVPADQCTSNMFYGCSRSSNLGQRLAINPVMSARVRTAGSFSFRYGRFEAKAKLPRGDWIWPAIWLLPESNAYGSWPASGEIDIMESRGNGPAYGAGIPHIGGVDTISSAVHWGPHYTMDSWDKTYGVCQIDEGTYNDDFHIFGLYWDENGMYTYVDTEDNKVLSVDFGAGTDVEGFWKKGDYENKYPGVANPWVGRGVSAPYDQRFYIVMNVAVGGVSGFFPDNVGGKSWDNRDPDASMKFFEATQEWYSTWNGIQAAMQVEWVKVWQTKPDYFLDVHAASPIAETKSNCNVTGTSVLATPPIDDDDDPPLNAQASYPNVSLSSILTIFIVALAGGATGAFLVGRVIMRRNAARWSNMYEEINAPSSST